ncbi:MAG: 30S ribosomal protein S4 [Dehalococcoidia bacterium]|nr:30S ribosomal protein S4 [Dehalococcoidia bacterium]
MGRYTGPVCRLCRRVDGKLFLKGNRCLSPKCAADRRGARIATRGMRRRRLSDRGLQLREKQKARFTYGVLETQFRRVFASATHMPGVTGDNLVQLLERRLDNVVYRLGFADSRANARQLILHGHFQVNGRKVDIPSFLMRPGDKVTWKQRSQGLVTFDVAQQKQLAFLPGWLSLDKEKMEGQLLSVPSRAEVDVKLDEKAIVEYYAR